MKTILMLLAINLSFLYSPADTYVTFTLRNSSLTSIPLEIPGVMNPNLSPVSNSGVSLKIGQKIFFRHQKKKHVLLVVDKTLEGKTLNIPKLIKKRKKEINQEGKK